VFSWEAFLALGAGRSAPLQSPVGFGDLATLRYTSGTTGRPTAVFHTRRDLMAWTDLVARSLWMIGVRPGDVFQNMMGYGLFTGGLGFHYGAERIGTLTIPVGAGNSHRQIRLMRDFGTTVVHIIPSYALYLSTVFEEMGLDPKRDVGLRIALIGAEPHSEDMRRRIEEIYGVDAYNSYGLTEMSGPGVAFECPEKDGMHLWEDNFIAELVDPESGEPVPDGDEGELVLTCLHRRGMPLLRYRTRDLTRFHAGPCVCGRTHRRIARIKGRTDDMFVIKGVNVFPMQVEKVLLAILGVGSNYRIVLETVDMQDRMKVMVEVRGDLWHGDVEELNRLQDHIRNALREEILVTPKVELVEPGAIPSGEGKAIRVADLRGQGG
jgi:phenylacetate-CoA ligase